MGQMAVGVLGQEQDKTKVGETPAFYNVKTSAVM